MKCRCGSGQESHWINDGHGIPLCRVCPSCEKEQMKRYRPDIMEHYKTDEPIEEE